MDENKGRCAQLVINNENIKKETADETADLLL